LPNGAPGIAGNPAHKAEKPADCGKRKKYFGNVIEVARGDRDYQSDEGANCHSGVPGPSEDQVQVKVALGPLPKCAEHAVTYRSDQGNENPSQGNRKQAT
jgi:hypothetical protein